MQNLSDKELDKRFKDAADGFRPAFDQEAWQGMEQKLDREAGDNQNGFGGAISRYLPFVLIFLTGSLTGILTWNQFTKNDGKNSSNIAIQTQPVQPQTDSGTAIRESSNATQQTEVSAESDSRLTDPVGDHKKNPDAGNHVTDAESGGNQSTTRRLHVPSTSGRNQTSMDETSVTKYDRPDGTTRLLTTSRPPTSPLDNTTESKSNDLSNDHVIEFVPASADRKANTPAVEAGLPGDADAGSNPPATPQNNAPQETRTNVSDGIGLTDNAGDSTQQIAQPDKSSLTNNNPEDVNEDHQEAAPPRNRLSVVAAFSPDFSSVNFNSHTRPGINAGLLVEYHFSPRISIQSGAILSQKIYTARNLEYNGYTAETADGDCRIIDIPVNINYRFASRRNYSIYVSAGFSSYLMKKEDYTFVIDSYNGPYEYSRSVRNENNEWFKVMNFSAGVSRRLSDRFFIEAEPFVKLPVSGIGDGKLNVNTIGLFVKLRYSFLHIQ